VYGESALEDDAVIGADDPTPAEPTATVAVERSELLGD
jgi:hypothetical protein